MQWKKIRKILLISLGSLILILGILYLRAFYMYNVKYVPKENKYTQRIAYIDPGNSLLSDEFETCKDYIFDYYNPERATYIEGKNGLRKFVLSNYVNKNYQDSGYLNFRFVINCKGEAGRYVIHQNDLDLMPKKFNKDLKDQLYSITIRLKKWNPNRIKSKDSEELVPVDSYMYISYRIENGEITEILP